MPTKAKLNNIIKFYNWGSRFIVFIRLSKKDTRNILFEFAYRFDVMSRLSQEIFVFKYPPIRSQFFCWITDNPLIFNKIDMNQSFDDIENKNQLAPLSPQNWAIKWFMKSP